VIGGEAQSLYRVAVPGVTIGLEAIVMIIHRAVGMTVVTLAVASLGIAGCSTNSTIDTDTNAGVAPLHAVPDGAQVVWGSASCQLTGSPFLTCEFDVSDPRVSGTETIGAVAWTADRQWTVQPDVITNAEGTWRGSGQGSDDEGGNPLAEARFVGEGGYEGLEFHYYVAPPTEGEWESTPTPVTGWISRSTSADPASTAPPVAPFHALSAAAVAVSGWAACDSTGSGTVDPEGELDVLVTCELDLSDPRVSGTETQDGFRILAGDVGAGDVRAADDARITTAEGTWRGQVQAATDDAAVPAPIGEAHYIGEGAYEGLEFHYYFADLEIAEDGPVRMHGWISPAP
jgi:hypothetical protein